jgi:EAL domain-containing protein (putative c-di-GMP-specific phosphodiesterase class I)
MYMAKSLGKNRHAVFAPSMHLAIQERLDLKADLLHAVAAGDEFEVYYQPIVTLDTGVIVGLEALARWNHPTRGMLEPATFIALAEEVGAIVPIGRSVLNQACRDARQWSDDFEQPLSVSVNVSARQLDDPDFVADVQEALRDADLSAERLVLEITESELMPDIDHSVKVLQTLKDLGVRIALDDFGTGYSSLSQLQRLPVDIVKVEQNFAGTLRNPNTHPVLVQAVMDIGKTMRLTTVAERIETHDQLRQLQSLDCPLGQGYLFSHPSQRTQSTSSSPTSRTTPTTRASRGNGRRVARRAAFDDGFTSTRQHGRHVKTPRTKLDANGRQQRWRVGSVGRPSNTHATR